MGKLNSKKLICILKVLVVIALLLIAIKFLLDSLARYESNSNGNTDFDVAFFVIDESLQENTILLGKIVPRTKPYVYTFKVSNFKGDKRTDVNLIYDIELITTTNLPLEYKLYKNQNPSDTGAVNMISSNEILTDEYNTYFKKMLITNSGHFTYKQNETDVYNLVVNFNEEYKNNPDNFEGQIEGIRVKINAKQDI